MISWSEDTGLQLGNNYTERIDPFSLDHAFFVEYSSKFVFMSG